MATMKQVKTGLVRFVDNDILPHLPTGKKVALGIYVALAANNLEAKAMQYINHPAVSVLEVVDSNRNVDIDKVYQAAVPMFNAGQKVPIQIPMIGEYMMDMSDVEKIYRYIKEA